MTAGAGSFFSGFGMLGATVFDWTVSASKSLKSSALAHFSEEEWKWFGKLRRMSKGNPVVLIVDNVQPSRQILAIRQIKAYTAYSSIPTNNRVRWVAPIGQTKGGMNTKLHAVTDTNGRPIRFVITAGHVSDYTGAMALLSSFSNAEWLLADRGYDADWFRKALSKKAHKAMHPWSQVTQEGR